MAFDFSPIGLGLSAVSTLGGLLGSASKERAAAEARDRALAEYKSGYLSDYGDMVQKHRTSLAAAAGVGGDAIRALGGNLGAALANAGISNSSAVAGTLLNSANNQSAQLANLASQNFSNEQSILNQGRQEAARMQMGAANSDLGYARDQSAGAAAGFGNFLGSLGQYLGQKSPIGTPPIAGDGGIGGGYTIPGPNKSILNTNPLGQLQGALQTGTQMGLDNVGFNAFRNGLTRSSGGSGSLTPYRINPIKSLYGGLAPLY